MKTRLLLTFALLLALSPTAHAGASDDARVWLDRLYGLVEESPFRLDYHIRIDAQQGGQAINAEVKGDLLQNGPTHSVNNLEMQVGGAATGGQTMNVHSRQVADGEVLWAETNLVEMGMNQVAKIDLATLAEIQNEASGLELNQSSMYMDPMSQIEQLVSAFDVSVLGVADGEVRLSLVPTEETATTIEQQYPGGATATGVLTLREADAAPVALVVELGDEMRATLEFSNFEKIAEADLPEDAFSYTPDPGVQVMDLAPLLKAGM